MFPMQHYPILYGDAMLRSRVLYNESPVVENGTTVYAYHGYEAAPGPQYSPPTEYTMRGPGQAAFYPYNGYHNYQPCPPQSRVVPYMQCPLYMPNAGPPSVPYTYIAPPHPFVYGPPQQYPNQAYVPYPPHPPIAYYGQPKDDLSYYRAAKHQHDHPLDGDRAHSQVICSDSTDNGNDVSVAQDSEELMQNNGKAKNTMKMDNQYDDQQDVLAFMASELVVRRASSAPSLSKHKARQ